MLIIFNFRCDNDNKFLLTEEYHRIVSKLNDMMISVCNYCHEQIAQLMMPERSYVIFKLELDCFNNFFKLNIIYFFILLD